MNFAQMDLSGSQSDFPLCPFCHSEAEVLLGGWKEAWLIHTGGLKKCVALVCDTHDIRKNLPWTTSSPKIYLLGPKRKWIIWTTNFQGRTVIFRECRFVGNSKTPSFDGYISYIGFSWHIIKKMHVWEMLKVIEVASQLTHMGRQHFRYHHW